jgi:hypothetical protein
MVFMTVLEFGVEVEHQDVAAEGGTGYFVGAEPSRADADAR